MKKAFTLIELVVSVALLGIIFLFAGVIFKVSINSYRTAIANTEIMQKLRAITDQLDADFEGLRKDGEIFVIWVAEPNSRERFDKIMFFADGDFQSYKPYGGDPIRGSVARICYMLAKRDGVAVQQQVPEKRILSRTQHILTAKNALGLVDFPDVTSFNNDDWRKWNNIAEYDKITLDGWKNMLLNKPDILTVIADITVLPSTVPEDARGTIVDTADANLIQNLLCEGVGEFKIQGWYAAEHRWVPDWGSGDFSGLNAGDVPGVLYPFPPYGRVVLGGSFKNNPFRELLNEAKFDYIPGLGQALKFSFTLYDSRGIIKEGRKFTHIVYLRK